MGARNVFPFCPSNVGLGPASPLLFVPRVNSTDDMFHPLFYLNNEL